MVRERGGVAQHAVGFTHHPPEPVSDLADRWIVLVGVRVHLAEAHERPELRVDGVQRHVLLVVVVQRNLRGAREHLRRLLVLTVPR